MTYTVLTSASCASVIHNDDLQLICLSVFSSRKYQDAAVPPAAREHNSKRKRERKSEGEGSEDGGEENVCPNSGMDKTTPVRKARGQSKGGQKLFSSGAGAEKAKGTGKEEELLLLSAEEGKPHFCCF